MNKVTNFHEDKKVASFKILWFLCKIAEDKLREKVLKINGLKHLQEGKGSLVLGKERRS